MTINEKQRIFSGEINVTKRRTKKRYYKQKDINLRNYWIEMKKEIMNLEININNNQI